MAADLAGDRLVAVLEGRPDLIKVSHEELLADERAAVATTPPTSSRRCTPCATTAPGTVIVSRSGAAPALALLDEASSGERGGDVVEIVMPALEPADPRGAGDSMTAGVVAALAGGRPIREALQVGAACGALNVVRHGLGTGGARAVETLAERVELRPWTPRLR